MAFDYSPDFRNIDFRKHPELYRIGRGEQGVLLVEPYKSEILSHWKFKTPELARRSADKIYHMFLAYKADGDFVGMDMARNFYRWAIRGRDGMQIIGRGESIWQVGKKNYPEKRME